MNVYKDMVRHWASVTTPVTVSRHHQTLISPTMHIRNSFFEHRLYRKIHVEYAVAGKIEILHQVAYPWSYTDIPIFGVDIMYVNGDATMGILDVSMDTEHNVWHDLITGLAEKHKLGGTPRTLPSWSEDIFSSNVVFLDRPHTQNFEAFAVEVQQQYFQLGPTMGLRDHHDFHKKYCRHQRMNPKTFGMLKQSFGLHVASEYIQRVMFDL